MASESDLNSGTLSSSFVYLQVTHYYVIWRCTMGYTQTSPALSISDPLSFLDGPRLQCARPVLPCILSHFSIVPPICSPFSHFPKAITYCLLSKLTLFLSILGPNLQTAPGPASLPVWEGPSGPLTWRFLLSQHLPCSFTVLCLTCTILLIYF